MDLKHKIEYEKNKPENRKKRLQESLPMPYPFAIALELSNDCNSNCYMCPRKNLSREIGHMSFELFRKIIDELKEKRVVLRKLFLHWMGEPLLNENFDKMIAYAREREVAELVVMASNLIALDDEKAKKLVDSKLDELFISLDAVNPETYEKIRGGSVTLDLVEKNIIKLSKIKKKMNSLLPYIRVKILKNDLNCEEIEVFKNKWKDIVDEIYVEEDINTWNGTDDRVNQNIQNDSQYKNNLKGKIKRWPCERLWYQLAVSQDGKVTPCIADWDGSGFIGDARKDTIFDIWNNPVLVEMRRKHLDGEYEDLIMCKDCNRWISRHQEDWLIKNRGKALAIFKNNE